MSKDRLTLVLVYARALRQTPIVTRIRIATGHDTHPS